MGRPVEAVQMRGILPEKVVLSTTLDPYLSLKALATYSGLSISTLRSFIDLPPESALPCYRLPGGGKILVRRSEFDSFMSRYRSVGRPS